MTNEELAALKALAVKATQGPWAFVVDNKSDKSDNEVIYSDYARDCWGESVVIAKTLQIVGDGEYIAAANPAVVLRLIGEVERLRHIALYVEMSDLHLCDTGLDAMIKEWRGRD